MYFKKLLSALMLTAAAASAQAAPLEIEGAMTSAGQVRVAISTGLENKRVGKAVLFRVYTLNAERGNGVSRTLLAACDGSWVSDFIFIASALGRGLTFADVERKGIEAEESVPLYEARPKSWAQGYEELLPIQKRLAAMCKAAGPEPRNQLMPVAALQGKDDSGASISMVLGTVTRKGNVLDMWERTSWFLRKPQMDPNGSPIMVDDVPLKAREVTGRYELGRVVIDCENRQQGTYELLKYDTGNPAPVKTGFPREQLKLSSVAPGTVGETQLDFVCMLYGATPK